EGGSALLRRIARKPQHILSEEALVGRDEPPGEQLLRLGTRLLVPMTFERRVVGLIALGAKRSGRFFSVEDLALLRTLANQGAVAMQNARSYHTLKRVNQELRDAQSRLIEAERSAAIGELSALVAHGSPASRRPRSMPSSICRGSIRCTRTSPTSSPRSTSWRGGSRRCSTSRGRSSRVRRRAMSFRWCATPWPRCAIKSPRRASPC